MSTEFESLIGESVQIWSNSAQQGYTDTGTLVGYDEPWVLLRTEAGDLLCFPIYNVRLVKCTTRRKGDPHLTSTD
jgi:hypothetical protein